MKKILALLLLIAVLFICACDIIPEIPTRAELEEQSTESGELTSTIDTEDITSETLSDTTTNGTTGETTSDSTTGTINDTSDITSGNTTDETTESDITETTESSLDTDIVTAEESSETSTDTPPDNTCKTHTDKNDDGKCDSCSVSVIITIDFYAINDLHGKFADTDADEGVDELTTYLKNAGKTDDYTIILSSGDMWQGSSESNLTQGQIITDWLSAIGASSMTLGNHEFDWGEEYIAVNAAIATFPLLAINVYDVDTDERVEYCDASVVIERGGLQIGIIGAIGDCYSSISADKTTGVYFKTGDELTELVKAESDRLRKSGVDFIIYSIHDGHDSSANGTISSSNLASYYDIELSSGDYVDLVFEGHTHQKYVLQDAYGVYHLQNGGDNRGISHVEIDINSANFNSSVNGAEFVASSVYENLPDDPIVNELLTKYESQIAIGKEVLGYNSSKRTSNFMRSLVAQLYYQKGVEVWGDKYDIALGGGFISIRSPYTLAAGDVTYAMLQSLFPFDNQLVLCSIKGSDLKERFINTTNSDYYCYLDASITDNIKDNGTYYIIVDSYSSTYAPNKLTEIARFDADVFARDLLADYIRSGGLE